MDGEEEDDDSDDDEDEDSTVVGDADDEATTVTGSRRTTTTTSGPKDLTHTLLQNSHSTPPRHWIPKYPSTDIHAVASDENCDVLKTLTGCDIVLGADGRVLCRPPATESEDTIGLAMARLDIIERSIVRLPQR